MGILKLLNVKETKQGRNRSQGMKRLIYYIFNPSKTEELHYTGGNHCPSFSAEAAYEKMMRTKILHNKLDKRQCYHFVLSFKPEEHVSPGLCLQITEELVKTLIDDYECVYAVHTDKKHMHSHMVFNSVSFKTGLKYHYAKGDWEKYMMPEVNRICKQYGLKELELEDKLTKNKGQNLNHGEYMARKKGKYTELQHIQMDLDRLVGEVSSYDELLDRLVSMGYTIRRNAQNHEHLSLLPPGSNREKLIRTDPLGEAYMPKGLKERIAGERKIEPYVPEYLTDNVPEETNKEEDTEEAAFYAESAAEADYRKRRGVKSNEDHLKEDVSGDVPDKENDMKKKPSGADEKHTKKNEVRSKRLIIISGQRVHIRKPIRMTSYQKAYLRYYRFFMKLSHTSSSENWKYNKDILRAQKMLDQIGFMLRNGISDEGTLLRKEEELQRKSPRGTVRVQKMLAKIKENQPIVAAWSQDKQRISHDSKIIKS